VTGLDTGFALVTGTGSPRRTAHDLGRVLTGLAVMLVADGEETISDLAVLREQADLFGAVASTATAWRVLARIDVQALSGLRAARAAARERAWLARAELGRTIPQVRPSRPGCAAVPAAGLLLCGRCGRRLESTWSSAEPAYRCRHGYTSATRPRPCTYAELRYTASWTATTPLLAPRQPGRGSPGTTGRSASTAPAWTPGRPRGDRALDNETRPSASPPRRRSALPAADAE
jgi:hypothetical protein